MRNDTGPCAERRDKIWQRLMVDNGLSTVPAEVRKDCEDSIVADDEDEYTEQVKLFCSMFGRVLKAHEHQKAGQPRERRSAARRQGHNWIDRADAPATLRRYCEAFDLVAYDDAARDSLLRGRLRAGEWQRLLSVWNNAHPTAPLTRKALAELFKRASNSSVVYLLQADSISRRYVASMMTRWLQLDAVKCGVRLTPDKVADVYRTCRQKIAQIPWNEFNAAEPDTLARALFPALYEAAA